MYKMIIAKRLLPIILVMLFAPAVTEASVGRATPGGSELFAYAYGGVADIAPGLGALDDGRWSRMWTDNTVDAGISGPLSTAWMAGGFLFGYSEPVDSGNGVMAVQFRQYDFGSGILLSYADVDTSVYPYFITSAYSRTDNAIYGYGRTPEGDTAFLRCGMESAHEAKVVSVVNAEDACISLCYNCYDGSLMGMRADGVMVRVSEDGEQTPVMPVYVDGFIPETGGMSFAPEENCYYWVVSRMNDGERQTIVMQLEPGSGRQKHVMNVRNALRVPALYIPDSDYDADAPMSPVQLSLSFEEASLSGYAEYQLPDMLMDGSAIEGSLDWKATLDGKVYLEGTGDYGSIVRVAYDDVEEGPHTFGFTASLDGNESPAVITSIYIGADVPKAPEKVKYNGVYAMWPPVTEGVNGGYVDSSEIFYNVYLNDEYVGETDKDSYRVEVDSEMPLNAYSVSVSAVFRNKVSQRRTSLPVVAGKPLVPEVYIVPTAEESRLISVNPIYGDSSWAYDDEVGCMRYAAPAGDASSDVADHFFLPPVSLDGHSGYYELSLDVSSGDVPAEFCVIACESQFAIDIEEDDIVAGPVTVSNPAGERRSFLFRPRHDGTWWIGVAAAGSSGGMSLGNFRIRRSELSVGSPKAVTGLCAEAAGEGQLTAILTFKMPVEDIEGNLFEPGSLLRGIVVSGSGKETSFEALPGAEVKLEVATVQGLNTLSVRAYSGESAGVASAVDVYTGISVSLPPRNLKLTPSADGMGCTATWIEPARGENDGFIDAGAISYDVYLQKHGEDDLSLVATVPAGSPLTADVELPAGSRQDVYTVYVKAVNVAGESAAASEVEIIGEACSIPVSGVFSSPDAVWPILSKSPLGYDCVWGVYPLADIDPFWGDTDDYALIGLGSGAGSMGRMALPRVNTRGMDKVFFRLVCFSGPGSSRIHVLVSTPEGITPVEWLHPSDEAGWCTRTIVLPQAAVGHDWMQVLLDAQFPDDMAVCAVKEFHIGQGTSVSDVIDSQLDVAVSGRTIRVTGAQGDVSVYTASGMHVATRDASGGEMEISLEPGVYIVCCCGHSVKVALM